MLLHNFSKTCFLSLLFLLGTIPLLHAQQPGDVVITEISYNPPETGSELTEFIELYNTTSSDINLHNWSFTSGVVYRFPNVVIPANGYFVSGGDSTVINSRFGITTARQWQSGGLSNGGEPIALKDQNGVKIDSLRFDDVAPWPVSSTSSPDGGGSTIVLCDPNTDNSDGSNWKVSTYSANTVVNAKNVYGSPGQNDSACISNSPQIAIKCSGLGDTLGVPVQAAWLSGTASNNQSGWHGTKGVASAFATPPSSQEAATWVDTLGNFYVFGGYSSFSGAARLNTFWKWDGTHWTWLGGDSTSNSIGNFGTKGVAAATNIPSARHGMATWTDANNNLWLLGGYGYDAFNSRGQLNDLWKYDGTNWTWVSGSNTKNTGPVYGTTGTASASNHPGGGSGMKASVASNGDVYVYGGSGYHSTGQGPRDEIWKWDGTQWTFVKGRKNASYAVYGQKGVTASTNYPGSRHNQYQWIDCDDNIWVFGGQGRDYGSGDGALSDLWKFDGSDWTWIHGDTVQNTHPVYNSRNIGVPDPTHNPGGRSRGVAFRDNDGSLWLWGGRNDNQRSSQSRTQDMWRWSDTAWTWMGGSVNANFQRAKTGTKGTASINNWPGGKEFVSGNYDAKNGTLYIFGGYGYINSSSIGFSNMFWSLSAGEFPAPKIRVYGNDQRLTNGQTSPSISDSTHFGTVNTMSTDSIRFKVVNTGDAYLSFNQWPRLTITGAHASDFSFDENMIGGVSANDSGYFKIYFSPADTGVREATLSWATNISNPKNDTFSFNVKGYGRCPVINPTNMDVYVANHPTLYNGDTASTAKQTAFDAANAGGSSSRTFYIKNTGSANLLVSDATTTDLYNVFSISTVPAGIVAPGDSTAITIEFSPTVMGSYGGQVSFSSNTCPDSVFTFTVSAATLCDTNSNPRQWTQVGSNIYETEGSGYFAREVDLSEDGKRAVVGTPSYSNSSNSQLGYGQMFEYDENTKTWNALGKPAYSLSIDTTGNTIRGNRDGTSIAISGDGKRMALGGRDHRDFRKTTPNYGYMTGGVVVYEYNSSLDSLVQIGQTIYGTRDSRLGWDVELSNDGNTLIAGAQYGDSLFNNSGYVRIYDYNNSKWILRGEAISGVSSSDEFGTSVAISDDGNTVAAGADYNDDVASSSGHVRIFTWNGTAWAQKGSTITGLYSGDRAGSAVALSADGNIVAIGEKYHDLNNQVPSGDPGKIRVFEFKNNDWSQMGADFVGSFDGDDFDSEMGNTVALSNSGKRLVVSEQNKYDMGAVSIYDYDGTQWNIVGCEILGTVRGEDFGHDLAISGNGATIIIGNEHSSSYDSAYAQVYYFDNSPQLSIAIDSSETCVGSKDGAVTATISGGVAPFTYRWSNGDTTASADSLGAGWHYLTIVDAAQDTVKDSIELLKPDAVIARAYIQSKTSSFTSTDGVLYATASGSTGPYTYSWSNSAMGDTARNLSFGYYTAFATDSRGCVDSIEILMDAGPTGNETYTDWKDLGADEAIILNKYESAGLTYILDKTVSRGIADDDNFSFEHDARGGIDSSGFITLQIDPDTAGDAANFSELVFNLSDSIRNLRFSIGDIDASNDHGDSITVLAYDANGNTVWGYFSFVGDSLKREYRGDTMTASSYGDPGSNNINSALSFLFRDAVSKIVVRHYMHARVTDSPGSQSIYISKFSFENDYQGVYDQYVSADENGSLTYDAVLDNELTYATPQTVSLLGSVSNGTVSIVNNKIEYTPKADYNGIDSVAYQICDNNAKCESAWLYISVLPEIADSMQWSLNNNDEATLNDTSLVYENEVYFDTLDRARINDGDNFTIESSSVLGKHQPSSYLALDINADQGNDPNEVVQLTANFKHPVANLNFKLVDVDGGNGSLDSVVIRAFDRNNNPVDVFLFNMGSSVTSFKNADGSRTFYGIDESSSSGENLGNVNVFIPDSVAKLVISYDPPVTADGDGNPNGQSVFITNLKWNKPLPKALIKFVNEDILHNTLIPSAVKGTDFDTLTLGDSLTRSFALLNLGGDTLVLSQQVQIVNESSRDFHFVSLPNDTLLPGDSSVFQIRFKPESYAGRHYSTLQFKSNDPDNGTYEFAIQGFAKCIPMAVTHTTVDSISCFDSMDAVVSTSITGGAAPYTYTWSNATNNDSLIGVGAGTYYLVVKDQYRCETKDTVVVTEPTQLVASASIDSNATCFGEATGKLSASATGGTGVYSYAWSGSSVTDSLLRNATAGSYTLSITDANGCVDTDVKSITQPSLLVAGSIDGDTVICSGASTNVLRTVSATSGGVGNYTYQWQVSTDSANWSNISGATNTTYQPGTIQGNSWFRRLDSDSNKCGPDTTNVLKVGVFAQPSAGFTATTACQGEKTIFTDTTSLAFGKIQSYFWSFGDKGTSNQQNPINIYKNSGSYTVKLDIIADGGCNSSISKTISVNDVPSVNFSATEACEGDATTFSNTSSISSGTLSYNWNLGDNNNSVATAPAHSYANAGFYTVQLVATSNEGCVDSVSKTVQVKNVAKPNFSATAVCEGLSTSFTNLSTSASTYGWNFGDASASSAKANPGYTYAASGSYTVVLTATSTDGCSDTAQRAVKVYGLPTAAFTATEECLGVATAFTNNSSGASAYQWIFGNGTSSNNASPSVIYAKDGNYTVELTATTSNGCRDVTSASVTVNALPKVAFAAADICLSEDLMTSNTTTGATSYAWNFGDGNASVATAPAHTYTSHGLYRVSLVATSGDGCIDSAASMINAYAVPKVSYTSTDVCLGTSTDFSNTSRIANGTMTYVWNLGDGSSTGNPSPSYAYSAAGTYDIKLVATSNKGCKDSLLSNTDVFAMPVVDFITVNVCDGDTLFTSNLSSGAASYAWSFGDGNVSTDTDPFNLYPNAGDYDVQLIATTANNCMDSLSKSISIYNKPIANFSATDVCDEENLQFANSSYNAIITGNAWSFGDATTDNRVNPDKLYAADGSYLVELIVSSNKGCSDTIAKTVTVHPNPQVVFANTTECDYDSTRFTNGSTIASGTMGYEWEFSTGKLSTLTSPAYQFARAGSYKVTLTATSDQGCVRSSDAIVVVNPAPVAAIDLSNNCEGDLSQLASASSLSAGSIASYEWELGDGAVSVLEKLSHLYAADGSYNVQLVVTSDEACTDTTTATMVVYNKPTASFSTPDVCFGQLNVFTDNSVDAREYVYDFGDKWGISTNAAPEYTYEDPGTYNATLFVTSENGCKDTVSNSITIYSLPTAQFNVNHHCFTENFTPEDKSIGTISSYDWSYDDGNTATGIDPIYTYAEDGSYNVKLEVTDNNGCIDSLRKTVVVWPLPVVGIRTDTLVSKGYTVPMLATGGVEYKWSPVDHLDKPLKANPTATVLEDITYTVTVANAFGCTRDTFVNLRAEEDYTLEPSNIMTPDGNGQNDNWIVEKAQYYNDVEVIVFDRWGRIVYQNSSYDNSWDGTSTTGEYLPDGAYYYIVKVPADRDEYKGSITIFR